jgi:hypothetical protein
LDQLPKRNKQGRRIEMMMMMMLLVMIDDDD